MGEILALAAVALLWSFLNGELSWGNVLFGVLLGMLMLSVMERSVKRSLPRRARGVVRFALTFLLEMVKAGILNTRLALAVRPRFYPHIVAVPLSVKSDAAIALLGLAISLIPGTVPMAISTDRRFMYCHAVNLRTAEDQRRGILRIESLILEFME